MTWHQKNYKKKRNALIAELGGECEGCGTKKDLAFDHPLGCTWNRYSKNAMQRLRMIRFEIDFGIPVRLLCDSCNTRARYVEIPIKNRTARVCACNGKGDDRAAHKNNYH